MTNQEGQSEYGQDFSSDVGIRINDLEERTNSNREKINLVSKNLIFLKEEYDEQLKKINKENAEIKKDLTDLKRIIQNISHESEKWVRRDEIILIERMLKDFQPLEFVRKKDLEKNPQNNKETIESTGLERNKKPNKLLKT